MISVQEFKDMIEDELSRLIPDNSPLFPSLYDGGRYVLLAPCKRIRPLLTLASAQALQNRNVSHALHPACALEMVHTYSLIHDDLPCMDDDTTRRGQPTLHCVYNEGHATLVGDYLLTYAFEILASAPHLSAEQKMALVTTLAVAAGGEGMVGGQVMDLENTSSILEMHRRKTATLFQAALEFGGIVTNCSQTASKILKTFGTQFGKLFQLVDDILDKDCRLEEGKLLEAADTLYRQSLQTLKALPGDSSILSYLATLVVGQAS